MVDLSKMRDQIDQAKRLEKYFITGKNGKIGS